ncbi:helix-turn-helix domain-containing protein [Tamlana sp. 62-3]|uniref:Helix-turn-helix domain-containing protein n=1 Tax=Neotamlana sargassicola TaxID=2883125 RepID=A0A9X1I5M6_9FLAO|nr:helix-turn-helix domain-containing protein [Tamlana sargassicola]MCB4806641.1 helix-turn-helix domain-containing protein [Tamlana sargassicola]
MNLTTPPNPNFDIRRLEDLMLNIKNEFKPIKHEFYAIELKLEGSGKTTHGPYVKNLSNPSIMIYTPFQIISWDINLDWKGYYIIFTKDFIAQSKLLNAVINEFDYFKIDKAIPFEIEKTEAYQLLSIFNSIEHENNNRELQSSKVIESQLIVLLNLVQRFYFKHINLKTNNAHSSKTVIFLKFQSLLNESFNNSNKANTHSPKYYADILAIHPNHLNAIIKQTSGYTAKSYINNYIIVLAKSRLIQTTLSIKEIAYQLHFKTPNSFSSFFKKHTHLTPNTFRKNNSL